MNRTKNNNQYGNKQMQQQTAFNKSLQPHIETSMSGYSDIDFMKYMEQEQCASEQQKHKQRVQSNNLILTDQYEYMQYLNDDDSLLQIQNIMPEHQYRNYAKAIQTNPALRQTIAYKFYGNPKHKTILQQNYNNKYYADYLLWKQNYLELPQPNYKSKETKITKQSDLRQQIFQKQIQMLNYKSQLQTRNRQRSEMQTKARLKHIQQQYKSKLQKVLNQKPDTQRINDQINQFKKEQNKQKVKKLGFQQIQYPIIRAVNVEQQESKLRNKEEEKWKQINQKSFIDLIVNPPRKNQQINMHDIPYSSQINKRQEIYRSQVPTNMKSEKKEQFKSLEQFKNNWKLDIGEMIKMPYKQFLLFYNEFQRKIISLATPEQLKILKKHRSEALQRQQALDKLKQKIAMSGNQILYKLPPEKRNQLFELLYEDQLQEEMTRNK